MTPVTLHHRLDAAPGLPEDAPAALLLNPLGADLTTWDAVVPALAEHVRVLRCDARGHGRTGAREGGTPVGPYALDDLVDDALALLDALGLDRVHVVGLSLGGATAMRLAVRTPERVDRLALLCTSARFGEPGPWRERAELVRAEGTGAVADAVVARWLTPEHAAEHPEAVRALRDGIAATPAEGYASCAEAIAATDLREQLAGITAPTLVVAGDRDPATPPEHLELVHARITGSRYELLSPAAHLAPVERPGRVAALLAEHLTAAAAATSWTAAPGAAPGALDGEPATGRELDPPAGSRRGPGGPSRGR